MTQSPNVRLVTEAALTAALAGTATSAQITTAIDQLRTDLLAGAPGALDTLNELAAALGDDSNYATTIAATIATKAPLPAASKNGLTGWYHVDGFGADPTGTNPSTTSIQAAITAVTAAGGTGTIYFPAGTYQTDFVDFKNCNGVTVTGAGKGATVITTTTGRTSTLSRIFGSTGTCSNLTFTGMTFQGTAVDDLASGTQPRRSRTYTGYGFNSAILFIGDLVPATSGGTDPDPTKAPISNITVRDVEVIGSGGTDSGGNPTYSGLPIFLQGIRGEARIEQSRFVNTLDVGWTFCDHAIGIGNRSIRSADNGFSFSRGNKAVTAIGNRAHQAAYWAVWIAGFSADLGPTDIVCADNSGSLLGYGGICADVAPQHFTITGGVFRNISRGPSDGPTDNYGVGILVSGYPSGSTTPTAYAQNFTITGTTTIDAARGGILIRGAKNGGIYGNTIIRPGSTTLADGTTTVTTAMAPQNFGIAADQTASATVSNVDVQANTIIDDRATPVLNNAVYSGSATNWTQNGNRAVGNRLQLAESARTWNSGAQTFAALLTATAGIKVGSLGAASTVSHRISAPAGITREIRFETADVTRWSVRANTTAETGTNAGTDLAVLAYADDGTTVLSTPIQIARSTGIATFASSPVAPTPATADNSTKVATTAFVKSQGYSTAGGGTAVNVQTFTTSGTWTKPAGVTTVQVTLIGAGGGGGSGRRQVSGTIAGGGGGGGGGGMSTNTFPAAALGATVAVTVGSGGNGGAAQATDSTNGSAGTAGAASIFGNMLYANGGNAGGAGSTTGGSAGGTASSAMFSGNGAGAGGAGAAGAQPGSTPFGGAGGGGGGGISTTPAAFNGGTGGAQQMYFTGASAAGGTAPGGAGATGNGNAGAPVPGCGAGGGASSITGAGGAGGVGGTYGGGGGGGGASLNGFASGAGGQGGSGIVVVTSW